MCVCDFKLVTLYLNEFICLQCYGFKYCYSTLIISFLFLFYTIPYSLLAPQHYSAVVLKLSSIPFLSSSFSPHFPFSQTCLIHLFSTDFLSLHSSSYASFPPHFSLNYLLSFLFLNYTHTRYIYIYIYILSSIDRPVSFNQNSSVWLDRLDSRG